MEPLGLFSESDEGILVLFGAWPGRTNYGRMFGFHRDALFGSGHGTELSMFMLSHPAFPPRNWLQRGLVNMHLNYIRQACVRALYCVQLQRQGSRIWFPTEEFGVPGRRALRMVEQMIKCELRASLRY